jgi:hypothetical protein
LQFLHSLLLLLFLMRILQWLLVHSGQAPSILQLFMSTSATFDIL